MQVAAVTGLDLLRLTAAAQRFSAEGGVAVARQDSD